MKTMIRNGFDTVAKGYDHPSLSFFPQTASCLVEHLQLNGDERLLDICTGTGVVAIHAAQKLSRGEVIGIDLSAGMLSQAQAKADALALDNTHFLQMDLDHMDFSDQLFDVATISFGLFFMPDMVQALSRIVASVKPGGKIAISSFVTDAFSPLADIFASRYEAFGKEMPPLSWRRLATENDIRPVFNAAGLTEIAFYSEPFGYYMESEANWWDIVWNAGYRSLLNQLSEQQQMEFKQQHLAEVAELCTKQRFWLNTGVGIAIGTKPLSC